MRRLLPVLLLTALLAGPVARGQVAMRMDTTAFNTKALIAPGMLLGVGTIIHCFSHEGMDLYVQQAAWKLHSRWGSIPYYYEFFRFLPAMPYVLDLGLGVLGAKAQNRFLDRTLEAGITLALGGCGTLLMKTFIPSMRPDGTTNDSFPSAHACIAFAGAELTRLEYGWGWGAAAYVMATGVAMLRMFHDRHWLSDVLFGAGLGILCAQAGHWLLEPARQVLGFKKNPAVQAILTPYVDPFSGSVCAGLAFNF